MLEIGIKNVTKNYGFSDCLAGVSLEIMTGDRVALVGRNGTGKSTLLKIIAGEENATAGQVTIRRGATVGYLEQIPKLFEGEATVREVLLSSFNEVLLVEKRMRELEERMATETDMEALERLMRSFAFQQTSFETLGGYAIEEELARVLTGFGIKQIEDRPFNVLSGGQKTIVMLAQTLLSHPDILLLDEPTNHLDIQTLEWFESTLSKYRGTVIVVSHDRFFLDRVATKTAAIEGGALSLYHGNYTFSQAERERELLAAFAQYKNQKKKIEAMQAAIQRFRDWGERGNNEMMFVKAKMLERRLEQMETLENPLHEKPKLPVQFSGGRTGREVLRFQNLRVAIGGKALFACAELTLFFRERVCLSGANGTGKTTLLRAILGDSALYEGTITITQRAAIGYIPQEIRFDDEKMSVLDFYRSEHAVAEGAARSVLAKFFFVGDQVRKRVGALSGGEKVLLMLCVLVQKSINLLILDEPTNHIDIETREMLEEALLGFSGTLLFVSHDRYFIQKIADRRLVIDAEKLFEAR